MWCLCLALGMGPTGSLGDKEPPEEPHLEEALQYVNAAITTEKPSIAITFDDGPSASWTPVLLEGLRERGIKATFFLIGQNVEKNQDLVRKMSEEGHLIGNHTYHHVEITKIGNAEAYEEIRSTSELIFGITGSYTEYMRPPFGLWQKGM
ncbi:MAG: polysaccharide deacetylase family protein, partial [Lachnospiraceae bacterium]